MKRITLMATFIVIGVASLAILPVMVSGRSSAGAVQPHTPSTLLQITSTPVFTVYLPFVSKPAPVSTEAELKVAFIGDSGAGSNFQAVLDLIKREGADMVLHQGDFSYNGTSSWIEKINNTLGPDFPYLGSIGNHDTNHWGDIRQSCTGSRSSYAEFFRCRMQGMGVAAITGSNHEMYATSYKGLKMVMVGEDSASTTEYANFIQQQLLGDNHIWKVCSWHRNQHSLQIGSKADDMGWEVYETCKDAAAIIATGHEHSYHRTRTLTNMQNQIVDSFCGDNPGTPDVEVCVTAGRTFVFVSGLGGTDIRDQDRCRPTTFPYGCHGEWAKIYTSDQGATFGALFISFNVNGDPRKATGYFKNINNETIDHFEISASSVQISGGN